MDTGWNSTEEWIIAGIMTVGEVDRPEAIRRMQRRKDSMRLRNATEEQLHQAMDRFIQPEITARKEAANRAAERAKAATA